MNRHSVIFAGRTERRKVRSGYWIVEGFHVIRQGKGDWSVFGMGQDERGRSLKDCDSLRQCVTWIEQQWTGR